LTENNTIWIVIHQYEIRLKLTVIYVIRNEDMQPHMAANNGLAWNSTYVLSNK